MFCTNCGKELPDGTRFCVNCGAKLGGDAPQNAGGSMPQDQWNQGSQDQWNQGPQNYQWNQGPQDQWNQGPQNNQWNQGPQDNQWNQGSQNNPWEQPNKPKEASGPNSESMKKILNIFGMACGAALILTAVFQLLSGLFGILSVFGMNWYLNVPCAVISQICRLIVAAGFAMEGIGLLASGMNKEEKNAPALFSLTAIGAVLAFAGALLRTIFYPLGYHHFSGGPVVSLLMSLVLAAGLFALLVLAGLKPMESYTPDGFKESLQNLSPALTSAFGNLNRKSAAAPASGNGPSVAAGLDASYRPNQASNIPPVVERGLMDGPAPNMGRRLNENRNLIILILLNCLTCGLYSYFFVYKLAQDINIACDGDGETGVGGLGQYILFCMLTCGVYDTIWKYTIINRCKANAARYGLYQQDDGVNFLLWKSVGKMICGVGSFVGEMKLLRSANAICGAYNKFYGL